MTTYPCRHCGRPTSPEERLDADEAGMTGAACFDCTDLAVLGADCLECGERTSRPGCPPTDPRPGSYRPGTLEREAAVMAREARRARDLDDGIMWDDDR